MSENHNSMSAYISIQPSFSLEAANDFLEVSITETTFLPEEILDIQEAIFPYGGSFRSYKAMFELSQGVAEGQILEIHTPLTGSRTDSHLLSFIKIAVSDTQYSYEALPVDANASLPGNRFGPALQTAKKILRNSAKAKPAEYHHSYNG